MRMGKLTLATFAGILACAFLATTASAQGRGGGGKRRWRAEFVDSVKKAQEVLNRRKERKYVLLYVHDGKSDKTPNAFNVEEIGKASRSSWVFIRIAYSKDDPTIQKYAVKRVPTLIGMDRYGNEFKRKTRTGVAELKSLIHGVPQEIRAFKLALKRSFKKAKQQADAKKPDRALRIFLPLAVDKKVGYSELVDSFQWVLAYGRKRLAAASAEEDPTKAKREFGRIAKAFTGSPIEIGAKIELAKIDHDQGRIVEAIKDLKKFVAVKDKRFDTWVKDAQSVLQWIVEYGAKKVKAALILLEVGEAAEAKEALARIREAYRGTAVAKKADVALKGLR